MAGEYDTKDHEWVRLEDGAAVCGISTFAQKSLGDVVFVELPEIGRSVKTGEQVAVVESVKAASEVYAPIEGRVIAVNDSLVSNPALVNSAPLGEGWFFKLEPSDKSQLTELMNESAYTSFTDSF